MVKVLAIGDPHFKTDNEKESSLLVERLEKLVMDTSPDLCVILGDVLHTHERLHTTPLNTACDFIDRMRSLVKTYVLVGNHDMISNQQFLTRNHWMNSLKEWENLTVVDTVESLTMGSHTFFFLPYVPNGRFEEALDTVRGWKTASCIFAHQEFLGCKMGAIVSTDGDRWPLEYPPVVSGHIHSRQTPQKNVYYPGSAMQHAFGESEKNIIALLTFSDCAEGVNSDSEMYSLEEIDLALPRKKIVYMDVASAEEFEPPPETENSYKVTVSGNYDEFKSFKRTKKYKNLTQKGVKVVFKPRKVVVESENGSESQDTGTFTDVLSGLINAPKDKYLKKAYEIVVLNNK